MPFDLVGAGFGAAIGGSAAAMGVGKNRAEYKPYSYDPGAAASGQTGIGMGWEGLGDKGQRREGVQIDNTLGNETRGANLDALGMMREAAMGTRPSVAQLQMKEGMDDAIRSQQALSASARGPQALGMAQYQQGANTAGIQQATNAQTGQLRAQEMAQALGQYGQQGLATRSLDEARAAQQAELLARQRQLNDQYQLGLIGQSAGMSQAELNARMQGQGINATSYNQAQALNAGISQANAENEWKYFNATLGGAQGGMQGGGIPPKVG